MSRHFCRKNGAS